MVHVELIRKKIKALRLCRGFSASCMGRALYMDGRNYLRIESGERKTISLEELDVICDKLGISLVTLIAMAYDEPRAIGQ